MLPGRWTTLAALALLLVVVVAMWRYGGVDEAAEVVDIGVDWGAPIVVATGEGHRGPWRMNESDFRYVDDPTVAIGAAGDVGVAWADQQARDLYFQRYDSDGTKRLDEPANISASPDTFSWLPRILVGDGDPPEVFVLWQEIRFTGGSHGGEILFARSTDGGDTFSEPLNLSRTEAGAGKGRLTPQRWDNGSLDLARTPDGTLYAAWTEYEGRLRVTRSRDGGASFAEPVTVAGGAGEPPTRAPTLAIDPDGGLHLAWTVGDDASADIHYARKSAAGDMEQLADARTIAAGDGHADAPALAADGDGRLHLAYAYSADPGGAHYGVRHAVAEPDSRVGAPETGAGSETTGAHAPALAVAGAGVVHLLWERFPEPGQRPLGLGHALWSEAAGGFSPATIVPGTADAELGFNGSQQGLLMRKLAAGDDGAVAVVNSRFREGEDSQVRLFLGSRAED